MVDKPVVGVNLKDESIVHVILPECLHAKTSRCKNEADQ